jgi:uncharacterized secreted protein with C-terminal beta-propeller domain
VLTTFTDCDRFLQAVKAEAAAEVGPYGLPGGWDGAPVAVDGVATSAAGAGMTTGGAAGTGVAAPAPAPATASGHEFSTTNNQEQGVDEPDLAKTDGRLLVTVRYDPLALEVLGVDGDHPRRLGVLGLTHVADNVQLLLTGSYAVVLGTAVARADAAWSYPETVAAVVDLAEPAHPRVVRTFRVRGSEVDARMLAGRVVLVVQRGPELRWQTPVTGGRDEEARTTDANRALVARSRVTDWLPPVTTTPSHRTFAPSCADTWHASTKQGLGTVSVVSFDPASEASVRQTTILGNAGVVYASTHGLYLATPDWKLPRPGYDGAVGGYAPWPPSTTRIHAFDLTDPATPHYVGSGVVAGQVSDQYAMSEYDGDLRVATTVGTAVPAPGEGRAPKVLSDTRVTVLRPQNGALVQIGQVRGLGRGERIYGVRFLGALGYVVTFRQIDPLYVLDLSDPARPREVSHLKVTGYSAYLHPLGGGLLLGLGRHVDSRAHPLGEQLSVFDVSHPAQPTLRSRLYEDNAYSPAEDDHHAFLWWAKDRLVVVPMIADNGDAGGAVMAVYHVDDSGAIDRVGSVSAPSTAQYYDTVQRSLVIGAVLYVVTSRGVLASELYTLKRVAWLPFR